MKNKTYTTYTEKWTVELPFTLIPIRKNDYIDNFDNSTLLIYNPLTKSLKLEINDKKSILHSKYAYEKLQYFKVETYEN